MNSINSVAIAGNLGRDPELKHAGETSVANLSIALSRSKKVGNEWKDETSWINVVVFGKTAEYVCNNCHKGTFVVIQGRLNTTSYEKDGKTVYNTQVVADNIQVPKASNSTSGAQKQSSAGVPDEDVPF